MRYRIAPNAAVTSLRDAARLAFPVRRLLAPKRIRRVAAAGDGARDGGLRRWSIELVEALDVRLRLTDRAHIAPDQAYLVVVLHEGLLDVPLLLQLPLPMTSVARADLAAKSRRIGCSRRPADSDRPESPARYVSCCLPPRRLQLQGRSTVLFPQGSVLGVGTSSRQGVLVVARPAHASPRRYVPARDGYWDGSAAMSIRTSSPRRRVGTRH